MQLLGSLGASSCRDGFKYFLSLELETQLLPFPETLVLFVWEDTRDVRLPLSCSAVRSPASRWQAVLTDGAPAATAATSPPPLCRLAFPELAALACETHPRIFKANTSAITIISPKPGLHTRELATATQADMWRLPQKQRGLAT